MDFQEFVEISQWEYRSKRDQEVKVSLKEIQSRNKATIGNRERVSDFNNSMDESRFNNIFNTVRYNIVKLLFSQ